MTTEHALSEALTRMRKLEAELDNVKDLHLQLASRALRLELAVSLLSPDIAKEVVYPPDEYGVPEPV